MTKTKRLQKPSRNYGPGHQLFESILRIANGHSRMITQRLHALVLRVVEHAAAVDVEATPPARTRRVHYARVAMAQLAAVVDAGASLRCISEAERAQIRVELLRLEEVLRAALSKERPRVAHAKQTEPAATESPGLSSEELRELRELAARDLRNANGASDSTAPPPGS